MMESMWITDIDRDPGEELMIYTPPDPTSLLIERA